MILKQNSNKRIHYVVATEIEIGNCRNKIYGIKTITLFFDSSKRTELYKSSRTIAYYPANAIQTNGLGYPISIEGAAKYWREDILVQRRISPEITTSTVIAWRRNIPYSLAVRKMIEEINAFQA